MLLKIVFQTFCFKMHEYIWYETTAPPQTWNDQNHTHTQSPQRAFYSIVSKFITIGNTHNQNISLKNNNVTVKTQIYTHSNKYIRALAVSDDGSKAIFYYTSRPGWLSMSMQQRAVEWILILRCSLHTSSTHASNTL